MTVVAQTDSRLGFSTIQAQNNVSQFAFLQAVVTIVTHQQYNQLMLLLNQ